MRVRFPCAELQLEGDVAVPPGAARAAVVCHPHPQYGGDMNNGVVCAVAGALQDEGCAVLRFNFRGVGASGGRYGNGVGEVDDARAAVDFVRTGVPAYAVLLAGYSFGAMVAARAAEKAAAEALVAIAPPLAFFSLECLSAYRLPKLFLVGDRDQYCSVAALERELAPLPPPKQCRIIAGSDHFFAGQTAALAAAVRAFARSAVSAANGR